MTAILLSVAIALYIAVGLYGWCLCRVAAVSDQRMARMAPSEHVRIKWAS